jgi:CRISPR-associated protein Cmr3
MMESTLLIEPYDPVIFRDGRPFTDGLPSTTLPFPLPATIAGAIRSRSGEGLDFDDDAVLKKILSIRQVGPFAASWNEVSAKWELAFPAPADAVPFSDGEESIEFEPLRPVRPSPSGGCDLPKDMLPLSIAAVRSGKAGDDAPRFWRSDFMLEWLRRKGSASLRADPRKIGFARLPIQRRAHVAIDADTLLARDGMLFTTDGLEFTWPVAESRVRKEGRLTGERAAIVTRAQLDFAPQWPTIAPLGGERRLAAWSELSSSEIGWPSAIKTSGDLIRVVLVTPGAFSEGWKPSWCSDGRPPGTTNLELELVAAAVPRFQPVSGWDLHKDRRGPKATRFMAPAGSVYFFKCKGDPTQLWMRSISDRDVDRRDGYGIVLIGDC